MGGQNSCGSYHCWQVREAGLTTEVATSVGNEMTCKGRLSVAETQATSLTATLSATCAPAPAHGGLH
jgi:hypothetical protein